MSELRIFKRYNDLGEANNCFQILSDNNINSRIVEIGSALDSTFGGGLREFEIQILQSEFERANAVLEKEALRSIKDVHSDHYLFEFTNEELYDILLKPDEWSKFDYKLSSHILKDRGENVSDDLIKSLRKQRLADLSKPEESQMAWIYVGYLFSLLGGFLGMFIGWYIWKGKKTLPNGSKVLSYRPRDREHGMYIFLIGVIIFPIVFIYRLSRVI